MSIRTRVALCLLAAAASAAALIGVYLVFVRTYVGQIVDERSRIGAGRIGLRLMPHAAQLLDTLPVVGAVAIAVIVVIGLARRRVLLTVLAVSAAAAANVTTQLLKHVVLTRPNVGATMVLGNSFPSGHITLVASVVLAAVLVLPRTLRVWVTVLGGIAVVAVGMMLLAAQWHRPSDVIGGILVVVFWGSLAGAVAAAAAPSRHVRGARGAALWWAAGVLAVASVASMAPVVAASSVHGSHLLLAGTAGLAAVAAVGIAATAGAVHAYHAVA